VRKATCQQNCVTCNGYSSFAVIITDFGVGVNHTYQESAIGTWNSSTQYDVTSNSTWSGNNTSVATVRAGLTKGVSAGSVTVSAQVTSPVPEYAQQIWNEKW
jgi:hypothetical protein